MPPEQFARRGNLNIIKETVSFILFKLQPRPIIALVRVNIVKPDCSLRARRRIWKRGTDMSNHNKLRDSLAVASRGFHRNERNWFGGVREIIKIKLTIDG